MALDNLLPYQFIPLLLGIVLALLASRNASYLRDRAKRLFASPPTPASDEKKDSDKPFEFPRPTAVTDRLSTIAPVPYRPFRWGPFHVTMGIRNVDFESWIELDRQHAHYHRLRSHRARTRGDKLIASLPATEDIPVSGFDAARELVHELSEYLSRRYPNEFTVERHPVQTAGDNGWYGEGRIRTITMLPPVGATYDLDVEDPMTVAGLLVPDDLALMIEGTNGTYYLRAGAILTAGFWRLSDKVGMSLDDIHFSGNVPQYSQRLQTSLNRFFQRLPFDKLVQRNNYFFKLVHDPSNPAEPVDPEELGWADYMVGAEDDFAPGKGLGDIEDVEGGGANATPTPRQMRLRMERQTLRRLPKTRAVCFTIRTYTVPLEELAAEPGIPGRAASAIRSWPADVAGYKNRAQFEQYILPYLDECHQKQVAAGLVREEEQPMTDYPY